MIKVSIIIPTYNEANNIPFLCQEIFDNINKNIDLELIFIDDNSPDGTGQIAENMKKLYPVKVVHRSGKLGLGSAVIEGFKNTDRDILGVMDADLSHDPKILNDLIECLDAYDIAVGSRFEVESSVEKWNWQRKFISHSGVVIARILTKTKDPLSGYFFMRRQVIDNIQLKTKGYKILLEILVKGSYSRIKEIPFIFRLRKYSVSKLNYKEYFLFIRQLIDYSFYKIFK
jgi:dolichol-phosphate mannosyltransferase